MIRRLYYRSCWLTTSIKYWLERKFTLAGLLVVAGLILTAVRGDSNLTVGYQAFTFLFCLLFFSFALSLLASIRFSAQRNLPRVAAVGVPIHYSITLRNLKRRRLSNLTLFENLADPRPSYQTFIETVEPLEHLRNVYDRATGFYRWLYLVEQNRTCQILPVKVPEFPPMGSVMVETSFTPLKRGVARFKGLTLGCPDPFGIVHKLVSVKLEQSVLIIPKRYMIPPLALPGIVKYQAGGVALASSVGESEEFVALRDYRPGDPLRHIHWKSWAKTGKPIVKEYQDEFFVRHALILDTFGDATLSPHFEEAVSVAASFACTLQDQDSLLDLLFVGPKAYCFTIGRGLAHTDQMLEILATVSLCQSESFSALHQLVIDHGTNVSGCVCIFMKWDDERQQLVRYLQTLNVPVLVLVIVRDGEGKLLDSGPMRRKPDAFVPLEMGQIASKLAVLRYQPD